MSYIYLASPYSDPDPFIMKNRFMLAEQATALMIQEHSIVFSPIVHCHELAHKYNLPTDFDFWHHYCIAMLRCASALYILDIPGWQDSRGVTLERTFAKAAHIPQFMVDPTGLILGGAK